MDKFLVDGKTAPQPHDRQRIAAFLWRNEQHCLTLALPAGAQQPRQIVQRCGAIDGDGQAQRRGFDEAIERLDAAHGNARRVFAFAPVAFDLDQSASARFSHGDQCFGRAIVEAAGGKLARSVGQGQHQIAVAALRSARLGRFDHYRHRRRAALSRCGRGAGGEFAIGAGAQRFSERAVARNRVGGEIEAECILLLGHGISHRPWFGARQLNRWHGHDIAADRHVKQAALPAGPRIGSGRGGGEQHFGSGKHRCALRIDAIERTTGGQSLDLAAVEQAGVDALGKGVERSECAIRCALGNQFVHRFLSDALQPAEAEADRQACVIGLDRKASIAAVDAGG